MRAALACVLAPVALALAACGDAAGDRPPAPVRVVMTGPGDGAIVRAGAVDLRGTVAPAGASVRVDGEPVVVSAGRFEARVPLDAGGNVIDVRATAQDRSPAMTALRVVRRLTVRIPDVRGDSPDGAVERLAAAGLRPRLRDVGGLIEELLPVGYEVCGTDPGEGSTVDSGAAVSVLVAKVC
ncbi:MAG TPA: PASTA domain-containing protein [Solirubrobacteraceae bacterium]|nr:PASTA domain-containing protein [Solirubrobacteraceae bacterium]